MSCELNHREIMAEFLPLCDVLFNVISMAGYFCDVVFDLVLSYALFERGRFAYFAVVITLVMVSLIISQVTSESSKVGNFFLRIHGMCFCCCLPFAKCRSYRCVGICIRCEVIVAHRRPQIVWTKRNRSHRWPTMILNKMDDWVCRMGNKRMNRKNCRRWSMVRHHYTLPPAFGSVDTVSLCCIVRSWVCYGDMQNCLCLSICDMWSMKYVICACYVWCMHSAKQHPCFCCNCTFWWPFRRRRMHCWNPNCRCKHLALAM